MELSADTPGSLAEELAGTGYFAGDDLATTVWLACAMQRPILLEGEPGTGKTALAEAVAKVAQVPLLRLQCYEGIEASQALYDWDFPRQVLHLRTLEAVGASSASDAEADLYTEKFLLARPILAALQQAPAVLLVDEIDRADSEFEAFLLEMLAAYRVSIPELGQISASDNPPLVILTSNRSRELHEALKRRCLYSWIDPPDLEREIAIVQSRVPEVSAEVARQVATVAQQLRVDGELTRPPSVAETIDWARAMHRLESKSLNLQTAAITVGALVKDREDAIKVRSVLARTLSS